ncbi:diaminopimelate epimerase [Eggerthella sp. YY7918]|uniref:diaminopimelate epimerase n=1 Tax=Eggerthella sp. (strain YY7918) TaxID=502558 RepID=UPI0002171851|nr:diaminopimelate epimerase [Eggerthella sp. YY7918]BAK45116.1 diaminopimelate epimerase [Eggerthella sp. YY7918]
MHFTKMHGLGNDYLYVYGEVPEDIKELSTRLSDRHFGAGADGMIYITNSAVADFKMRIFNADGSEAAMCGNGIRCVGKYVYDKGYTDKTRLSIETLSGIRTLQLHVVAGTVRSVTVDMGMVVTEPPVTVSVGEDQITLTPVSVGNPHAVVFVGDVEAVPLATLGAALEHHELFPDGVNVEFVQVLDNEALRMRVWERGSGITLACGTGACASVGAAIAANHCQYSDVVAVQLDGGTLKIEISPDNVAHMGGPAHFVYEGETLS